MSPEKLWRGDFGDDYTRRNVGLTERNVAFLARALSHVRHPITSVLEFGCGSGQNLAALDRLLPMPVGIQAHLGGIEINKEAADRAEEQGFHIHRASAIDFRRPSPGGRWDLVLSKGFLIHVSPDDLAKAVTGMYEASNRYILLAEYYNPVPVEVQYRGEMGRMWKRDFATEFLGRFPSLRVVDYGFCWRYDPWPQDDLTYFLLEKR